MNSKGAKLSLNDLFVKQYNEKRNWFRFAVIEFGIIVFLVVAVVATAMISKPYPWIVQVDEHGFEVSVGTAGQQEIDPRIVISRIGRFIESSRSVIGDVRGQQALLKWSFASVASGSKAQTLLNQYLQENNPYTKAANGVNIEIRINNILPKSDKTYQANWTEIHYSDGNKAKEIDYTGIFVVSIHPTRNGKDVINNPLGIYITEYTFGPDYIQK